MPSTLTERRRADEQRDCEEEAAIEARLRPAQRLAKERIARSPTRHVNDDMRV